MFAQPIDVAALWPLLGFTVAGYLLGAVPFGLVLTRLAGLGDIRRIGSGNIGATNVLRTGNKGLALVTLLLDGGKGAIAVLLAGLWSADAAALAGGAAVLGHLFPVWLGFKGGKGVATTFGLLLAIEPLLGLVTALTWLGVAWLFRYSSLSALVSLALAPVHAALWSEPRITALAVLLALLSWVKHHENIRRLLKGEESRIRFSGKNQGTQKETRGENPAETE